MGSSVISYWLAEHPAIVRFRWSHAQSWGATWPFLFSAVAAHCLLHLLLHSLLRLLRRRRPVPLGPLPALHSLLMAVLSAAIFAGTLLASAAELRDTRWLWRRRWGPAAPLRWLLCFPLGTRPSGRVFFWSYAFYLSRFLHLLRSFLAVLRRPAAGSRPSRVLGYSASLVTSFLWLEFSQSLQLPLILATTMVQLVLYAHSFWPGLVRRGALVLRSQMLLLACHVALHAGVVVVQLSGDGGCSGIGAWAFNSLLNTTLFVVCNATRRREAFEDQKKEK